MEKKCNYCNEIKPLTEFYRKTASPDGYQRYCKICSGQFQREGILRKKLENPTRKVKKDAKCLNLVGMKREDYRQMYSFLSKIGYNPELDIHIQFCEKWGLKVSKSPRKGPENKWTYDDFNE